MVATPVPHFTLTFRCLLIVTSIISHHTTVSQPYSSASSTVSPPFPHTQGFTPPTWLTAGRTYNAHQNPDPVAAAAGSQVIGVATSGAGCKGRQRVHPMLPRCRPVAVIGDNCHSSANLLLKARGGLRIHSGCCAGCSFSEYALRLHVDEYTCAV